MSGPITRTVILMSKEGGKSSKSMMAWDGWFSRFMKEKLGPDRFEKVRDAVLWRKDDEWGLEQHPRPDSEMRISKEDPTKTVRFRHPSPGSAPQPNLPAADEGSYEEDPYNIAYYPIDTRTKKMDPAFKDPQLEQARLELMDPNDPAVKEAKEKFALALEEGPGSSPGNKGMFATGKSDFDPTGLRATMSTNHAAVKKVMDSKFPSQIPLPYWYYDQDETIEWYESRGLPVPLGGLPKNRMPTERRIAKW